MKNFNEWLSEKVSNRSTGEFHYDLDEKLVNGKYYSGEIVVNLPHQGSANDMDYAFKLVGFNNLVVSDEDGNTSPVEDTATQQMVFNAMKDDDHFNNKSQEVFADIHGQNTEVDPETGFTH